MKEPIQKQAFIQMLEAHKGLLYKIARSYTTTPADCQDLVQEITLALWRSFEKYNQQYEYSTWIYRIALNVSISHLRKETRRIQSHALTEDHLFLPIDTGGEDAAVNLLYSLIAALNPLDKAIMLLYLDEKSYREMAEILGLSESNIATKISRIKEKWRQQLNVKNT
ncbi:RNA polymerase sigma factor [Flavihumibacter sp. CACIAM 22H1]|uniref:RNA polymerase sigma factor n=1 Tax=Flavihumibacter sp. CACIAM 22H1 TaxID=1812911 RepID=UPI0007A86FD2|nr:RNA polymerase sigma factor [Flavihumibacter sp. CACIAM 22H1]KYP15753.1 MAG: RNA polymerase subunit sigma-70 [Flavihumibacter sp. CACIAM 22H1]